MFSSYTKKTLQKRFRGTFVLKKQKRLTKRFDFFFVCKTKHSNINNQKKRFPVTF
eukprot:UN02894